MAALPGPFYYFLAAGRRKEKPFHGIDVRIQIRFRTIEPNRRGIVRITGEKQAVEAINQRNCIRGVARRGENFQCAAAKVDFEAVVHEQGNVPWLCSIGLGVEIFWQVSANHVRAEFGLRVFSRTLCVGACEARVHAVDESESPVVSDVVVVRVGVQDDDGAARQLRDDLVNVGNSHAGVEEERLLGADDEIGDDFFGLVRFVDGEDARRNFIDFEPRIALQHALQRLIFWTGKRAAPFRNFFCLRCQQDGNEKNRQQPREYFAKAQESSDDDGAESAGCPYVIAARPRQQTTWHFACAPTVNHLPYFS
jgi:hypothetical protein